jgi:hypothetical protein
MKQQHGVCKSANKVIHFDDGVSVLALERRDGSVLPCYIDTIDYPSVGVYRWYAVTQKGEAYATHSCTLSEDAIRMHVLLTGETDQDHRDRNGLNNRRLNLRPATRSQQGQNTKLSKNNVLGYRGVYRATDCKTEKYKATIRINGKRQYLGRFTTAAEAGAVTAEARKKLFGEFAPKEDLQ